MVPDAPSPPAIRARLLWARLRQVERLPPVDRAAILAGLGATTVGRIETAGPLAWLPVETSVAFTEAVFMRLGAKRAQRFFESTLAAMAETALFRPFVQAVVDAVASDVVQGLAWLPKGWALAHRDCGRLRVESRGVGVATIRIVELPSSSRPTSGGSTPSRARVRRSSR